MAREQKVVISDDLTGEEIDSDDLNVITFNIGGVDYRLDLSSKSAEQFDADIEPWIERAVRTGGRKSAAPRQINVSAATSATITSSSAPAKSGKRRTAAELKEIRVWAAQNGYEVSERGRIPQEVQDAYDHAA